ncbi:MAG: glycerol-3-phosphate dehydrogenase/oxidase [Deltaproteobacteria bacterium]|nr:glycerol-3-phosphate dehydrogenase/oxidase [Deltaproteobacteria bacterium]
MDRVKMVAKVRDFSQVWDVVVIGGGATGLGTALDAATRGYRTLLLEQHDFSKGTSSRSTKLIHGGVRYLKQGNISLVLEALHERGLLMQNASHLVRNQSFIVPAYSWWDGPFYGVGMKVYDLMAGKLGLGHSRLLSREETIEHIPTVETRDLHGGVLYFDGQFDDSRLAINLAQTIVDYGGVPINYMKVLGLLKARNLIEGVVAEDAETGTTYEVRARVVVNATGVYADKIVKMDDPAAEKLIVPSQGVHLVLDREFLPGDSAIMVPHTDDGRVLFAVPWHGRVVVGTTDTIVSEVLLEPRAQDQEVDFILNNAARYLAKDPGPENVLSVFAGLRPLANPGGGVQTAQISRDHHLMVSHSGLVTITGGKWTTYRKMAEDTINQARLVGGLAEAECCTANLPIHGSQGKPPSEGSLEQYGADGEAINNLIAETPELGHRLHERLPYLKAEVVHAVRREMARTVEDVLARRMRALFLDAVASVEMVPEVIQMMAAELGRGDAWQESQLADYRKLASAYVLQ